jgi:hypothetical protein
LKHILTNAHVLNIVDPEKYFLVCIDARKEVIYGVPMQEGHLIYYNLRNLNENDHRYVIHGLELTTIAHALKM